MFISIGVAAVSVVAIVAVGGVLTEIGPWYRALRKPAWQPADWVFGPVWTAILTMAAGAGVLAWHGAPDPTARWTVLVLFAVNAVLHVLWSPLFFRWRRPDWALVEVGLLWLSILALIVGLAPYSVAASGLVAPYLVWVTFAAWLNYQIVRLNRPFGR